MLLNYFAFQSPTGSFGFSAWVTDDVLNYAIEQFQSPTGSFGFSAIVANAIVWYAYGGFNPQREVSAFQPIILDLTDNCLKVSIPNGKFRLFSRKTHAGHISPCYKFQSPTGSFGFSAHEESAQWAAEGISFNPQREVSAFQPSVHYIVGLDGSIGFNPQREVSAFQPARLFLARSQV